MKLASSPIQKNNGLKKKIFFLFFVFVVAEGIK